MAELNVTNIPAPRVPFIDARTGLMAREWYRFFLNLFVLTGSGSNPTSLDELQIGPPNSAGLTELLIQISKDIEGAFVQPVVQTGTIASFNLNNSPTAGGVVYGTGSALAVNAVGTLGQVLTSGGAGAPTWTTDGGGTVTSVSVVSANGLAGTVATATTTPAITLSTTVTGVVKGNGTTLSAAVAATDYVAPSVYASVNGLTMATTRLLGRTTASTGAAEEISVAGGLTLSGGTLTGVSGTVTAVSVVSANGLAGSSSGGATPALTLSTTITGLLKGNGTAISAATSGTDYAPATSGTSILYGDNLGGFANVTIGSGVTFSGGTLSATGSGGTVTSVSGTAGRITSTGGTTPVIDLDSGIATAGTTGSVSLIPVITIDTYGRVTTITTAANPQGTVTSVTGTAPVVSSGGATPAISMATATTSVDGYLTSTDWNTFNSKGSGTVTSVSVVSANGLAGTVATATTTPAITLTTSITGILKGNGTAISAAVANVDYVPLSTVLTKTADYTITGTDTWIINNKTGSSLTLTFPAASSWTGRYITVKNLQTQTVVSASSNIVPIDSTTAGTAILLGVVGNSATLVSDGTNWVIMQTASNNALLLE